MRDWNQVIKLGTSSGSELFGEVSCVEPVKGIATFTTVPTVLCHSLMPRMSPESPLGTICTQGCCHPGPLPHSGSLRAPSPSSEPLDLSFQRIC